MQDLIILGIIMLSATILTALAINYVVKKGNKEENYEYYFQFRASIQAKALELDDDTFASQAEWEYLFKLAIFSDEIAQFLPKHIKAQLPPKGTMLRWVKTVKAGD